MLSLNCLFPLGLFARGIVTGTRFQHVGLQERKVYGKVPASWRIHHLRDSFAIYRRDFFKAGDVCRDHRTMGVDIR